MPDSSTDLPLSATSPTTIDHFPEKDPSDIHHESHNPPSDQSSIPTKNPSKPLTPKSRDVAVRAAKREIATKLREDWTWPPTSPHSHPQLDPEDPTISWRSRDSDSEYSPPSPIPPKSNPYRFDTPDSITPPPTPSRKRKRHQRLEEELRYNTGLRTFISRRDAWAGAQPSQPLQSHLPTPPSPYSQQPTLLPLAPPILPPTNPIRASILPSTYPAIYSKIIIRGQAPSIPINLSDVVNALVAGWKKDGEWPPVSKGEGMGMGIGDMDVVGPRRMARRGVGRVKRVLGLRREGVGDGEG